MIDEYSPIQTNLKPKPSDNFGLGGLSNFGLKSTSGAGVGGGGGNPVPFNNPLLPESGGNNVEGVEGGALPAGSAGSLLRYNGSAWVSITPPSGKESVVVNSTGSAGNYIQGNQAGGIIYFDGLNWDYLDGDTTGERVLVLRNGQPEWLDAPASGTRVLGSNDGVVEWLETESCDDPP
jgi:hypothetical protein